MDLSNGFWLFARLGGLYAHLPEKAGQDRRAFLLQHAADAGDGGVQQPASELAAGDRAACLRIERAEADRADAEVEDRPHAHRAGLERYVEAAVIEPFSPERSRGAAEGKHLRVGGGVLPRFNEVMGAGDDLSPVLHDRADGDLALIKGKLRLRKRFAHEFRFDDDLIFHNAILTYFPGVHKARYSRFAAVR